MFNSIYDTSEYPGIIAGMHAKSSQFESIPVNQRDVSSG